MGMNEQIKLDLQVDGRGAVKAAASDMRDLGEAYELVEAKVDTSSRAIEHEVNRIVSETRALKGYLQASADVAGDVDQKFRRFGRSATDAGQRTADLSRFMLHLSQSSQDLVQGGFGAILNNLPQLAEGAAKSSKPLEKLAGLFGGPAGLAAVASFAGLALYGLQPALRGLWAAMTSGSEVFPKTVGGLKGIEAEIKANAEALETLQANWRGTRTELEEANRLIARNDSLQAKAAENREREARADAIRKAEASGKLDKEGGEQVRHAMGRAGGFDAVAARLAEQERARDPFLTSSNKALEEALAEQAEADREVRAEADDPNRKTARVMHGRADPAIRARAAARAVAEVQARIAAAQAAAGDRATDLATRAADGDREAIDELAGRMGTDDFRYATKAGQAEMNRHRDDLKAARAGGQAELDERDRAKERGKRVKGYDEQDAKDAQSPADEARQSEMIEFIERNLRRLAPRMGRLTDEQALEASALAMRHEDAGSGRAQAAQAAFKELRERDAGMRDKAALASGGGPAAGRLGAAADARRESALETASAVAAEEFPDADPSWLQGLAKEAADNATGPDVDSIRRAMQEAVWRAQRKWQAQLERQMGRQQYGGDPYYE